MEKDEEYLKTQEVSDKPIFSASGDIAAKVINHLLIFGIISIFNVLGQHNIKEDSSILKLIFSGIHDEIIYSESFVSQIYQFIHL